VIRLLLDENVSPALVKRLGELCVYAQAVSHVGLSGRPDHAIWKYALDHDFTVVTANARDFIELLNVDVHPGLIVFRQNGLSREEQWLAPVPVIEHVKLSGDQNYLLNKLVEIVSAGQWHIREIPASGAEASHKRK
jgi:predicted nuclease of predicted toxin-antitoxin system